MFVSFEGADGSGKSTQAELLRAALAAEGRDVVLTREPGGTELGEAVRTLVLNGPDMGAWAEAALFAASRAEHVEEVIRPALERGADVVCDRYRRLLARVPGDRSRARRRRRARSSTSR